MADVRYSVQVDSTGAVKSIETLDAAFEKLGKESAGTGAQAKSFGSDLTSKLIPAFTAATLAADGIKRALGFLKDQFVDTIKASMEAERADRGLEASLAITGRSAGNAAEHFKRYASELQRQTVYGDEAIKSAQTLLIQLTDLDRLGIDRATKGAIGLASTLGMDLTSAANLVAKAIAGNMAALSRYGIRVDETLSLEEKREQLMTKLEPLYKRATEDADTYGGKLQQLKEVYGDLQESIGDFVTQNKDVLESLNSIKYVIEWITANAKKFNISLMSGMPAQMKMGLEFLKLLGAQAKAELEAAAAAEEWSARADELTQTIIGYSTAAPEFVTNTLAMRFEIQKLSAAVAVNNAEFKNMKNNLEDIEELDPASLFPDPTEFMMPEFLKETFAASEARMRAMSQVWRVETNKQRDYSEELYSDIRRGFTAAFNSFKLTAQGFGDFFIELWKGIKNAFFSILADMLAKWVAMAFVRFLVNAFGGPLTATAEGISIAGGVLGGAPAFASGFQGVVSRPTPIIVGEAGPEYLSVVPMTRPMSTPSFLPSGMTPSFAGAGGGGTVTVNISGPLVEAHGWSESELMRAPDIIVRAVNKGLRDLGHRTI